MMHTLATALLLLGLAVPAAPGGDPQPEAPAAPRPPAAFSSPGRSYLGVDIQDITHERAAALKLKEERGVEITTVDADAPAGKAGLREHDVILQFNDTAVESEEQLRRLIRETPPGRTVTLGISRDGAPMKVSVQLAEHRKVVAESFPRVVVPAVPRIREFPRNGMDFPQIQIQTYSSVLGAQTENLTRQLGDYFGVKNGEGILVRSVEKGSAAEKAGLKAGDVIIRADNEKITDRSDLSQILRKHRGGGPLALVIMRDKHEQSITVTLPDRGSRDSSMLEFDSEELTASLDEAASALEGLKLQELAPLHVEGELLNLSPEIEKAMREAERELEKSGKILQELKLGHDFI
ncbi:MAG TPA: PDZ domain-containing protein [Candidatus Angelobacter sp.]|nr:PDZ domain-containing protein [Candidatus Angelobacter sp.]